MTDRKKRRKLSQEILATVALCFVLALVLGTVLARVGVAVVEEYCFQQDMILEEEDYYRLDRTVITVSAVVSVFFFVVLFLALFGDKLTYIRTITKGVDALRRGEYGRRLPVEGNNELTHLAEEVNYLSQTEAEIKEKERALAEEKEALIRALSHDIRTPLTAIVSYTELLSQKKEVTPEEQGAYFALVRKKAGQIGSITEILLDGGNRHVEHFSDASLLFRQLTGEFEEGLEDAFQIRTSLAGCPAFEGDFDVQEMRRIFDNLLTNVQKYADPASPVILTVTKDERGVVIREQNAVREGDGPREGYRMGIYSMRRIAQNYGGTLETSNEAGTFCITVTLADF